MSQDPPPSSPAQDPSPAGRGRRVLTGLVYTALGIGAFYGVFIHSPFEPPEREQILPLTLSFAERIHRYSLNPQEYDYQHSDATEVSSSTYMIHDTDLGEIRAIQTNPDGPAELDFRQFLSPNYRLVLDSEVKAINPDRTRLADETYLIEAGPLAGYHLYTYTDRGLRVSIAPP